MSMPDLKTTSYQFLRDYIAEQTGIELGPDRQYLVESRLEPVMEDVGCNSLAELCRALIRESHHTQRNPTTPSPVHRKVIHALSTHETSFFRDPDFFGALRKTILPELAATNFTGRMRFWSAAASSGQEAYSVAILAAEMGIYPPPLIVATDISAIVLEIAAEGFYTEYELMRGLEDPALRAKYVNAKKGGGQMGASLRQTIEFQCADLRDPSIDFSPLDLILCRNVLIYFEEATRLQVLKRLSEQLRPGGVLILGAAEAIWTDIPNLNRVSSENLTYYRKSVE
jgi:chemotaxis protein methyltransferase CheR